MAGKWAFARRGRLLAYSAADKVEVSDTRKHTVAPVRTDEEDAEARSRLSPALRDLVDGQVSAARPVKVVDGRVTVKVWLVRTSRTVLRRLERAGLRLHQVAEGYVIASVPVAKLLELAALGPVERVTLP